jgi:hypothetical protein
MKKFSLKNVREILSNNEMKNVRGGSSGNGTCHCKNGTIKYVASCSREACENACGGEVQNCNSVGQ